MTASRAARLLRATPLLPSLDLDETERFYAGLGFSAVARSLAGLTLRRDDVELDFWLTANRRIPQSSCCSLHVTDLEALLSSAEALPARKGRLVREPLPGSTVVQDCHGNELYLHGADAPPGRE